MLILWVTKVSYVRFGLFLLALVLFGYLFVYRSTIKNPQTRRLLMISNILLFGIVLVFGFLKGLDDFYSIAQFEPSVFYYLNL